MTELQTNQIDINDYVKCKVVSKMFNFLMTSLEKDSIKQSQAMNMMKMLNKITFHEPLDDVKASETPCCEVTEEPVKETKAEEKAEPNSVFGQTEPVSNYVTDNTCNPF